jgi:hypothetical protein
VTTARRARVGPTPEHRPADGRRWSGATYDDAEQARAGLAAFFEIADRWRLSGDEAMTLLGRPPRATFYRWKRGAVGAVGVDLLERLSHVIGIHRALHTLYPDAAYADDFVRRPSPLPPFDGAAPLTLMLGGAVSDLYVVRQALAARAHAGW